MTTADIAPAITVISCLFDLGTREGNPDRQGITFYLEHARPLLALDVPMVLYVDRHLVDPTTGGIAGTDIVPLPNRAIVAIALEETAGFPHLPAITAARSASPFYQCNTAKDTPLYHVFQRAKYELLARAAIDNPFHTSHVAWIDVGIAKAVSLDHAPDALAQDTELVRPMLVISAPLEPVSDFRELRQRVSAGYIAGPCTEIAALCQGVLRHANDLLARGIAPHDETLIEDYVARSGTPVLLRHVGHHSLIFADRQPLLGLVMIVKNEAHGIATTLATFAPYVDRITIVDTGSTDDTVEVVRQAVSVFGPRAQILTEPFVDFSTTRNRALDLHDQHLPTLFSIMADADDHLIGGPRLRAFLQAECLQAQLMANGRPHDAYGIQIRRGGELNYELPLVRRTSAKHRYTGRVHECAPIHTASLPSQIAIEQHHPAQSVEASKRRWVRDLAILCEEHERAPRDPRTLFYLAQTQACLGLAQDAIATYEKRLAIPDAWHEETYESMMRRAHLMKTVQRPWPEVMEQYLEAHAFSGRAEPLYEIADHYRGMKTIGLAYLFAQRAAQIPMPVASLFVDRDVYTWKAHDLVATSAFYVGAQERAIGRLAAERAVRGAPDHEGVRANHAHYAQSAKEVYRARILPIAYTPEAPYVATNPSVHYDLRAKRWRCLVRTTNYRIVNGQYLTPDDNVIFTKNVMLELNDDLSTCAAVPMIDRDLTSRSDYPVHGYEDCRLFQVGDRLYATATVCDFTSDGRREIVLLAIASYEDGSYVIERATPVRGMWSAQAQKNWMPLASSPRFPVPVVYAAAPTIVFHLRGDAADPQWMVAGASLPLSRDKPTWKHGRLRGGSQVVRTLGDRYLCLVHDVTFSPDGHRTYLHRFVELDEHLHACRMGDLFYFHKRGIEFCAGLAYDWSTDRLVASFGVDDSSAHVAIFDLPEVLKSLRKDFVI